ncbi:MAG: peptidoglycan-binding domain-containing protein [Cyanobacteria bacterium J06632_3]
MNRYIATVAIGLNAAVLTGVLANSARAMSPTALPPSMPVSPEITSLESGAIAFPNQPVQLAQAAYPTLTIESTGEAVNQLQAMLSLLGFYQGEINGTYDSATQTAVAQFQAAAGIVADGIVGPSTWQKLLPTPDEAGAIATIPVSTANRLPTDGLPTNNPPNGNSSANTSSSPGSPPPPAVPSGPPILRPNAEGAAVAQLQRELQELGYYNGPIDGGYGELTKAAVEQFQADQQLVVDAIVGPSTWDALSNALDR